MHNTQPWRFRVRRAANTIELHADPARTLRYSDPRGRALHIACGAALFNLRLAAAVAGRQPVVQLLPDPGQALLWPRSASPGHTMRSRRSDELHAAITRRHTNRGPFSGRPVPPGVLAELADAAELEGAMLHILDHDETILRAAPGPGTPNAPSSPTPPTAPSWPSGPAGHAIGRAYPTARSAPAPLTAPRRSAISRPDRPGPPSYAWFEETPQLTVLSVRSGEKADWLRACQALQRVLLTATARGIAATPLTQPLETADAWLVRDPRSRSEQPQMILRIGYGLPVQPTPRRPVPEVLDEPQPGEDPPPGSRDADGGTPRR